MANGYSKEEIVAFEEITEGFHDGLVMSEMVDIYRMPSDTQAERSNDEIWRPQPYIMQSYDGVDQTGNYGSVTQLSVPARVGYNKSANWSMSSTDLRDALQEGRLGQAAKDKLASDVNVAVMNVISNQSTLFLKRDSAATGFDDIAAADTMLNEIGLIEGDRCMALSSRNYNRMAGNLAARETMNDAPTKAYRKASVGMVAGFETVKLDYANRLTAAAGTSVTIGTQVGDGNFHVPKSTTTAVTGETSNYNNKFQQITVSSTTNVKAGDAFTIGGVESVHHITKNSTGELKPFRVMSVDSATTMTISPPIISAQGGSDAEEMYKNCEVDPQVTANITFLNTTTETVNPFWCKGAIELMPSSYGLPNDAGLPILRARTPQGLEIVMVKELNKDTFQVEFRVSIRFGVTLLQPEMVGLMMFNQA